MDVAIFKAYDVSRSKPTLLLVSQKKRSLTSEGIPDLLRRVMAMPWLYRAGLQVNLGDRDALTRGIAGKQQLP